MAQVRSLLGYQWHTTANIVFATKPNPMQFFKSINISLVTADAAAIKLSQRMQKYHVE
jgi:hypothetical protein